MSTQPRLAVPRIQSREEIFLIVFSLGAALFLLGPLTVAGSLWWYTRIRFEGDVWLELAHLAAVALALFLCWMLSPYLAELYQRLLQLAASWMREPTTAGAVRLGAALATVWLATIPSIPVGATLLDFGVRVSKYIRPRTLEERLADEERWLRRYEVHLSRRARRHERRVPPVQPGVLRLGPYIKGDVFPPQLRIGRHRQWLTIAEPLLDQHVFVVGTTGAGKTEALKRLVNEILVATKRDLFVVDGKGDDALATTVCSLAFRAGRGRAPIFRLGSGRLSARYDGFRGAPQDIYSRLASLVGVGEAEGAAQYYADINRDLLQLICYAPGGPPHSFEEVRERLSRPWLLAAWQQNPAEVASIEHLKGSELEGLARRLRPLVREFAPLVGPDGFALEETHCAIFSIRTQSVSDTARRFLHFLVEDLKDFAGKRQRRPGVLIIDEFGAFGNQNVIALLGLARSAQMGVILATQDIAALGDAATTRLILANTRTKLLLASDFPEEIATLAGTIYQVESSLQHAANAATGLGSARVQHAFKVDMNEVSRLQAGEGFLIRQRHAAKLRIASIGAVPPLPDGKEEPDTWKVKQTSGGEQHAGEEAIEL